jgi:hypothetical protein
MKNWLLMFKPDTYELVRVRGVIGVLHMHRRRFAELADGDRFIAYVSRRQVFDGHGTIVGIPFEDIAKLYPGRELYPQRCRVAFDRVGAAAPAKELLWELDVWKAREKPLTTQPWNMLFCYGGFMEVPESDYRRMVGVMG